MNKILSILAGLMFIIGDLILNFYIVIRDAIKLFFTMNKKNNEFIKLLSSQCLFVDLTVYLGLFIIIGHFSVIIALVVEFFFYFYWYSFKERVHNDNGISWSDGATTAATLISALVFIIFSIYLYAVTPYKYVEIGDINLTQKDITFTYSKEGETKTGKHRQVDFNYNNTISDVEIGKCKPGNHIIYDETVEPYWFNYIYSDFVLDCSGYMEVDKKIKLKDK